MYTSVARKTAEIAYSNVIGNRGTSLTSNKSDAIDIVNLLFYLRFIAVWRAVVLAVRRIRRLCIYDELLYVQWLYEP